MRYLRQLFASFLLMPRMTQAESADYLRGYAQSDLDREYEGMNHKVSLLFQYHNGLSPNGQFFSNGLDYAGLGLYFGS